jgi:hypothetical protein
VHAVHPDPLPASKDDHADGVGTPPADHYMYLAPAVPFRMRTQHVVRIVMLARDQALDVRALRYHAKVSQ